jgi:phage I-like protein
MADVVEQTRKRAGSTELVVDYDHQSVFSAVPGVGGLAPAAGWIKEFEVRTDGLYGRVEWTDKAAQAIKAGEYRYISPVYQHDKSGKVIRLISAGLTNSPNLDLAAVAASSSLNPQEEEMDKIALALGLAAGASEADILAAINSAMTSVSAIAAVAGLDKSAKAADIVQAVNSLRADIDKVAAASGLAAGAKTDDIVTAVQSAVTGQVDPAKFVPVAQVVALQADLNTLKATVDGDKAETAVNRAIEDGKLVPALKQWGLDLFKADKDRFDAFVGVAPVLTATQRAGVVAPANGDPVLSETDLAVMSQMGIAREDYIKTLKGGEA